MPASIVVVGFLVNLVFFLVALVLAMIELDHGYEDIPPRDQW